ncbi:hypothetical protein [Psychrobacter sp. P2G3]|uniref:hypothetical protein n=1 Tax=Psychrobacter sp. P2G3 TaxID=1699622 RepID=UPI00078E2C40|nr:hypothetical protein [Psychrobacter sp. P2G3]AMN48494.1 hypothetical protein AK823_00085 [Psychrobacter sp. P2G3]
MPLQMLSELRFSMGTTESLNSNTVDDFVSLIRKVSGPIGQHQIMEIFKRHFCKVSNDYYAPSSSLDWAESDMSTQAYNAAKDAPNFIAAMYEALEELKHKNANVPTVQYINQILKNKGLS